MTHSESALIQPEEQDSETTSMRTVRQERTPSEPRRIVPKQGQKIEFRREDRREFRYNLSVACAIFVSWLMWLLPGWLRNWIADRSGEAFLRLFPRYRETVIANLQQVMDPATSDEELYRAARQVARTSARNFMDLLVTPRMRIETFVRNVKLAEGSWSILDDALAAGKGAVVITAHLGAFDYMGQALTGRGYRLTTVTGRTTTRFIFDGVSYLRGVHGHQLVDPTHSGVRQVLRALRRGECAAFVTDLDYFQNGRPVTFFGRRTTLPPGPVRIARDTGAPIVPVYARRMGNGYAISIDSAIVVEKTSNRDADIDRGLEQLVATMERAIAKTPEQWVMFQRGWPLEPDDPDHVARVDSSRGSELLERVADALAEPRPEPKVDAAASDQAAAPTSRTDRPDRPQA